MHKLVKIFPAMATRRVELVNCDTGTTDICFDDAALMGWNNFEFMEIGKSYNCKIVFFGDFVCEKTERSIEPKILNPDVLIGNCHFYEVSVGKDIYYIIHPKDKSNTITPFYEYTRKDLAQVDGVVNEKFE